MENLSSEIVGLIYQLLPGFLTACIFYLFTSYLKPAPFERIIQALIFTVLTKAVLIIIKSICMYVGNFVVLGTWSENLEFVLSIVCAIILGIILSWCVNNDFPLWLFRRDGSEKCKNSLLQKVVKTISKINLTNKALYPTEWYSFFKESECDAVLHLDGERRLKGYLMQFPDSPDSGHFIVINASWLLDNGTEVPLTTVDKVLINTKEVVRVELLKNQTDINENEIARLYEPIYSLYSEKEEASVN